MKHQGLQAGNQLITTETCVVRRKWLEEAPARRAVGLPDGVADDIDRNWSHPGEPVRAGQRARKAMVPKGDAPLHYRVAALCIPQEHAPASPLREGPPTMA